MNYAKVPKLTRDQLRVGGQHGRRRGAEVGEGEGEAEVGVRVTEPGLHTSRSRVTWVGCHVSALRYLHRVAHVQLQGGLLASLSLQRGRGKVDQTGRGPLGHSHLQQRLKLVYVANSLNFWGDSLNDNCSSS